MQIIWYGQFCFQITTQKKVNIVIDSFNDKTSKLEADILLNTYNNIKTIKGDSFLCEKTSSSITRFASSHVIDGPGEYEIKEVFIQGIESDANTIYIIEAEGMRVCHLGNLEQKELLNEQVEKIGDVDILMIPTIKEVNKIISQIEPKIIIPIYSQKDDLDNFLKLMGIKSPEPLSKLSIKKKDVLEGEAKIIVLKY